MKEEKNHVGRPTNEEVKERKKSKVNKIVLGIILFVICAVLLIVVIPAMVANKMTAKLNETVKIDNDKIKITVLDSSRIKIDNGAFIGNGEYIKVKLNIENYGKKTYNWTYNFCLGDKIPSLVTLGEKDVLPNEIKAGEKVEGYLYFDVTKDSVLEYVTYAKVTGKNKAEADKYYFWIK